jgi:D-arginine dehydrogenase
MGCGMTVWTDIIIIGAGMAGTSIAAQLAGHRHVVVLEQESQPGYHSTGRSAAAFAPSYGNEVIGKLTVASKGFYESTDEEGNAWLSSRRALWVADDDSLATFEAAVQAMSAFVRLDLDAARGYCDRLRGTNIRGLALEEDVRDIDVDLVHRHFIKQLRKQGGEIVTDARVHDIKKSGSTWQLQTEQGIYAAPVIVNAAGAWGDVIARLAGVETVGLQPKKRTAALIDPPEGVDFRSWPLIADADERWYCRPMGGRLMISPADETPVEPHDAYADELDIATGIDRFQKMIDIDVERVVHSWAGLRSFVADKSPVIGFDDNIAGFFWCVGQGGYGIQTAPAAGMLGASLLLGRKLPEPLMAVDFDPASVAPGRLRASVARVEEAEKLPVQSVAGSGDDVASGRET